MADDWLADWRDDDLMPAQEWGIAMAMTVVGYAWIEDQRSSIGTDHLVPLGAAFPGANVRTACGLDLVAHVVKEASENGRMTQAGGGFDVGDDPTCGNVTCKACVDKIFQSMPIPNGSERRTDGKTKPRP